MSSSVFMKVLESAPHRYDRGILLITRGRIKSVYLKIAEMVAAPGKRVLDVGCGTGNVSLACAERGAQVVGIDINAEMLEVAREKAKATGLEDRIELLELGVAEMARRIQGGFDAAVACLTFSELTADEQIYTLSAVHGLLRSGGALVIADESLPEHTLGRLVHRLRRLPFAAFAYAVTQTTTRPLRNMAGPLRGAGFTMVESVSAWSGFTVTSAVKGETG